MNKEEFIESLKELNINITEKQLEQFNIYYHFLIEENKLYNLTTILEEQEVYLKHFYDSLTISKIIKLDNQSLCDIGTGAGFPGIVLKIIYPNLRVTLLDSTLKKCKFLNKLITKLNLANIEVINERAETYSRSKREFYDLVVSRAVAPLKHLLEYGIPLLKVNGNFISMKANINEEFKDIDKYIKKLKLSDIKTISFKLPKENSNRTIIKIIKKEITPSIYPRKYNEIKKSQI